MNKLFVSILGASIAALVLAVVCGAWLFLQSWEEGKRLEQQNRELMASLAASRVRLENFCEYPAEALCNIDEPKGSVSGVMADLSTPIPSLSPLPEPETKTAPNGNLPLTPSSAQTAEKNVAPAPAPTLPAPVAEEPAASSALSNQTPNDTEHKLPPADMPEQKVKESSASAVMTESPSPDRSHKQNNAATAQVKKTWTSLDVRGNGITLRIAGAGSSLKAQGMLHQQPLRYEVTLSGLWRVASKNPATPLVTGLQTRFDSGNTLLTFSLSQKPQVCTVKQEDARTIAIIIR